MYNLLVVDDDVDILNINQIYFSNIGFNVYTSETAKDAMDIVERIVLDCIILDISLPDIDGYKMCNDIKEKVNIPIIFYLIMSMKKKKFGIFSWGMII